MLVDHPRLGLMLCGSWRSGEVFWDPGLGVVVLRGGLVIYVIGRGGEGLHLHEGIGFRGRAWSAGMEM